MLSTGLQLHLRPQIRHVTPGYVRFWSTLAQALLDMARFMMRYEGSLGMSRCSTVRPSLLVCTH